MDWFAVIGLGIVVFAGIAGKKASGSVLTGIIVGVACYLVFFIIDEIRMSIRHRKKQRGYKNFYKALKDAKKGTYAYGAAGSSQYGSCIKIHRGYSIYSEIVFYVVGNQVQDAYGSILYYIVGNQIQGAHGSEVYTIDGNYIRLGVSVVGEIIFYICGDTVYRGTDTLGDVVYYIER